MNSWSSRFVIAVGLAPLMVAAFVLSDFTPSWFAPSDHSLQIAFIFATSVLAVPVILLFRGNCRRGRRGVAESTLWTLVLGLQLAVFQPLWAPRDCASAYMLMTAQSSAMSGLWFAACVASWLGWRTIFRRFDTGNFLRRSGSMHQQTFRLIVAYALIPFLPGLFFILIIAMDDLFTLNNNVRTAIVFEICAAIAIAVWLACWCNAIAWKKNRVLGSVFLALLFLATPWPLTNSAWLTDDLWSILAMTLPLIGFSAWLIGTAILWREKSARFSNAIVQEPVDNERGSTQLSLDEWVKCPACNYSMKGLREIKCPECGWISTVDGLFEISARRLFDQV